MTQPLEAALRGVALNRQVDCLHLSFTLADGQVLRLLLSPSDAQTLARELAGCLSRSVGNTPCPASAKGACDAA